jgi:3-(3-hydroxy-phenyl)propionate hydroxylase
MYFTPRRYPYRALDSDQRDVIVAGAGPVGLATALGLARRGVRVTLLEQDDSVCFGSRAICLSRHSLEVLDRLGVGGEITSRAVPWYGGRSYLRDVEVLSFSMPHADSDPHPPMVNISQSAATQVLADAAMKHPNITFAWRHSVMFISPRADEVEVTVDTPEGLRDLTARWLVGADGGRSIVREDMGLFLRGTSYAGNYLIADIHWKAGLPAERRVWFDPPASPGQTIILHQQPDDIWRFDCQLPSDADPAAELEETRLRQRIATHLDWLGNTEPWTIEWASVYSARALSLDEYAHGRVVFAGDAAHMVPIFGVRGLNSGLEDADTLAWMLALVASGTAEPGLLRAYAGERRDAWQQNITQADLSTLFMSPATDGYRLTRDAVLALAPHRPDLRELINPRQTSATHCRTSPLTVPLSQPGQGPAGKLCPGDPVPDAAITVAGRPSSLHAERGAGFTLLALSTADSGALAEFTRTLRSRLAPALEAGALIPDNGDQLAATLGVPLAEVLLIRPDGLLLRRCDSVGSLGDPAELARHILRGGTPPAVTTPGRAPLSDTNLSDTGLSDTGLSDTGLSDTEQTWRLVSEALDQVPARSREAFLVKLVLLLAVAERDPASVRSQIADALAAPDGK